MNDLTDIKRRREYQLISDWYGTRTAERSGVPLINHIDEGLLLLNLLGASIIAQSAFCLHPLIQHDNDFLLTAERLARECSVEGGVDAYALTLAMEYRSVANAFLSDKITPDDLLPGVSVDDVAGRIRLSPALAVNGMLVADKIQNRKDFLRYHKGTHPRSRELDLYFRAWLVKLGVSELYFEGACDWLDRHSPNVLSAS
jgi:hypothetical protein